VHAADGDGEEADMTGHICRIKDDLLVIIIITDALIRHWPIIDRPIIVA